MAPPPKPPRPMEEHVALVTGAGAGIGKAIALKLGAVGARVMVNDLDPVAAQATADAIQAAGGSSAAQAGDISDPDAVATLAERTRQTFGPCSCLVNNAGIVQQALFQDLSLADWERMFAVHVRGTFLCTQAVLPAMLAQQDGCVITIASQLGQKGGVQLVHYSAAKAALIGFTKALALEVSGQGVRVNAVAPGPIDTDLVRALSPDWRAAKEAELPLGRFGDPEDVAETVAFLASSAARIYVGQTLGPNSGDVML